jgi:hypothetical protein
MKMVWHKTGDFIELDIINHEVLYFLIENWEKTNCSFFYISESFDISNLLSDLQNSLQKINNLLINYFKINDLNLSFTLNQDTLNLLHERWVILNQKYPLIKNFLEKKEKNSEFHLENINEAIHKIEHAFYLTTTNRSTKFITSIFDETIATFGLSNIFLHKNNLGKFTYEKWQMFDKSLKNEDCNDFNEFPGKLGINLSRPYNIKPNDEYADWCKENGLYPAGDRITLANFKNLENNLTMYRQLFVKNFSDIDNPVRFLN